MGEAGVQSGHVVQSPQPRACPPPPVRSGLRDGGGAGVESEQQAARSGVLACSGSCP